MYYYEKVLLKTYSLLPMLIIDCDNLVKRKAHLSFASHGGCIETASKIIEVMEKKDKLIKLKFKLEEIFEGFTDEELWLLERKYFKRRSGIFPQAKRFVPTFTERTYFRKQKKMIEKFSHCLKIRGLNEEWFLECFSDFAIFNYYYYTAKNKEEALA